MNKQAAKYHQGKAKPEPGKPELSKANKSSEASLETSRNKTEAKKQEEEKKSGSPTTTESASGHYELNERMTKMVESELQDIMIKVWQELPDNPSDEVERVVVDKLRNKLSDNLRNVLGLNVTKRLLNIHNPLYVKVQFSGKPEKVHLGEFLKKYNFIAFKRIEKTDNMFAAQVKNISDFDKICGEKEVKCGNIKVIVNPMYTFTKCPPNLVSSFCDDAETSDDASAETTEKLNKNDKQITSKGSTNESVNTVPKAKVTGKAETAPKGKEVAKDKVTNKTDENSIPAKTTSESKIVNKTVTTTKTINKPAVVTTNTVKTVTEIKSKVDQKSNANKVINKQPDNKTQTVVDKKTAPEQKADNSIVQNKTPAKQLDCKPVKAAGKLESKMVAKENQPKANNDYDELDDNDILALMSEGIVLDEWSGSED